MDYGAMDYGAMDYGAMDYDGPMDGWVRNVSWVRTEWNMDGGSMEG